MSLTVIKKYWFYSGVLSFLIAGLFLGVGLFVRLLIPIFSEIVETYPGRYRPLMELSELAWILIIAGIVFVIVGSLELNYAMKPKLVAEPKVEGKFFCRYCGKENKPDAVYCEGCGKKL